MPVLTRERDLATRTVDELYLSKHFSSFSLLILSISFEMAESPILPPEVFRQIFSLVTRDQLSRCARVSKTWCQHATPVLYENVNLTWRRSLVVCKQSWDNMHMDRCVCERTGLRKSERNKKQAGIQEDTELCLSIALEHYPMKMNLGRHCII